MEMIKIVNKTVMYFIKKWAELCPTHNYSTAELCLRNFCFCFPLCLPCFEHHRQDGNQNDDDDDVLKVFLHEGDVAKQITREREEQHPDHAADNVVGDEVAVSHFSDACHEGRKGADDGNKAREEDGFAAVLFKERMGLVEIFLLDPLDVVRALTKIVTDGVIDSIAEESRRDQQGNQDPDIQRSQRGKCARRKQERITGQEGHDHEACFHEDHCEENAIGPCAVICDDLGEVLIQMQEEIDKTT